MTEDENSTLSTLTFKFGPKNDAKFALEVTMDLCLAPGIVQVRTSLTPFLNTYPEFAQFLI